MRRPRFAPRILGIGSWDPLDHVNHIVWILKGTQFSHTGSPGGYDWEFFYCLTWFNENFKSVGPDSEDLESIRGIHVSYNGARHLFQDGEVTDVGHGGRVVHARVDKSTFLIGHNKSMDAWLSCETIRNFLRAHDLLKPRPNPNSHQPKFLYFEMLPF